MTNLIYEKFKSTAVLRINNGTDYSLSFHVRKNLFNGLCQAEADKTITAIVIIGSEKNFSFGFEIEEIHNSRFISDPDLSSIIDVIETSTKPVIAAISGNCLGGGLELALGCHFRIATPSVKLALPEVKMGLLPRAGGTQRLPRVLGVEAALSMIISGQKVSLDSVKDSSLFDDIVDGDLFEGAINFASKVVAEKRSLKRIRDLSISHPKPDAYFMFARNSVEAISKNNPAPLKCVEALNASIMHSFDDGLKIESKLFDQLYLSSQSQAKRHLVLAEKNAVKVAEISHDTQPRNIRSVAVIGAGTMGSGIAINFLIAGIPVTLLDTEQEALDRGSNHISKFFADKISKRSMTLENAESLMKLFKPTLIYDDLKECDLVIEAVFENMQIKQSVFEKLDSVCKPGAILASNTSTLDLNQIANFTKRPQDVVGTHFFSPANVMKLLEVVRGDKTADDVLITILKLSIKIKKIPVVSGVCYGFIGNRMIGKYCAEANKMLEEGATVQQIDTALEKFGMAMGPFRMSDLAGNDIGWSIRKGISQQYPDFVWPSSDILADKLCELGRFGQKSGLGWYSYAKGKREAVPDPAVEKLVDVHRKELGFSTRDISDREIVERCIFALVNEGAKILEEGIAQRASDIDIVYIYGYGFPLHAGGPMFYADQLGLLTVERAIQGFEMNNQSNTATWPAALLLSNLASSGKTFN